MERLIPGVGNGLGSSRIAYWGERVIWESGRASRSFSRRFGVAGWGALLSLGVAVVAGLAAIELDSRADGLSRQLERQQKALAERASIDRDKPDTLRAQDARSRLQAFAEHLLPHRDIPRVVEEILLLAESHGLSIERGEYRMQAEHAGRFMRYQMALPVKGDARTVQQFIQAVLLAQKSLAMESVQFKRLQGDSPEIEARIQWVLFVAPPVQETERVYLEQPVTSR